MFVAETIGDQIVDAYSIIGLVIALYVVSRHSFCFPQDVPERAFVIFRLFRALSAVFWTCWLKFSFGSKVRPRIFGFLTVGIMVLSISRASC